MANVCERCKRSMSSHDNHASCPQCWMAAGECSLDSENPCTTCEGWTRRQWGKLRQSLVDARARSCQRGRQHWSAAFPRLEAWILSKPVSTSASEISSQAGEVDFEDDTLVSTPNQQVEQVLVVQAQNGVNMASGRATTAPSTATTAPSTAPLQVAAPSTMEPIVEQLGQDTPSVIQGARPDVRIEQTVQSTQRYGTLPYIPGPQYTAPLPQYTAPTAPLPYAAPYATMPTMSASMPAMSARPAAPMGYYDQGSQFPFVPNPGWMTEEQLVQQQQLLRERQEFEAWRASRAQANLQPQPQMTSVGPVQAETNVDISQRSASVARARPEDQTTSKGKAKAKRAGSVSTSRRSPSPKRDYPRGTCTATRPSQASPKKAEHTFTPAQDLEAFKADMTSRLSDMLQASLSKFASQFNPSSGGQGDTAPTQTVASEPTVDVASNDDDFPQWGPEDQSEGEIIDSEGEPLQILWLQAIGSAILDNLKMSEVEQREYDEFSLASVSVPTSSKRAWRALGDSKASQSQPQDVSNIRQAHPQAAAKAPSVMSAQSDQRSVQLQPDQRQVQLRAPQDQANFPVLTPQGQGHRQGLGRPVLARRDDLDSLLNEEEFSVDLDNEAVLKEKQARSEILDKVAEFCNLDRQDPQIQKEVMGMRLPAYNAPAKKSIEISLPWHSTTIPIAHMNHDIVRDKFNKFLKPQNASKPCSPKDFFGGLGYYVHNTQGYLAKPDSLVVPSRPHTAERTAEDQPFFHVPRNPEDPRTRVDISSESASLTASQLIDQEAMSRKSAAAASTALSLAEFIDNYPGMPEGARDAMLLLKLDIVSFLHYAWREVHNKMLLRSIALDCLERTLPPIDEDQKLALLHAPFKGTTLFGGELAKLQEANTKRAATFTVFPQNSTSYSACPYVGCGKSFKDKKGFKRPGGRGRGQGRSAPSATITRPGQSKDGEKALTVSVSADSKKRKVESQNDAPQAPRKAKHNF